MTTCCPFSQDYTIKSVKTLMELKFDPVKADAVNSCFREILIDINNPAFLHQVAEDINEKIVGRFFQPHQSPPAQLQQVDCPGCNGAFQVPAYSASAQCLIFGTVTQLLPPAPASWAGGRYTRPRGNISSCSSSNSSSSTG